MSKRTAFRRLANLPAVARGVNSLLALLLVAYSAPACLFRPERTVHGVPPGEWLAPLGAPERAPFRQENAPTTPPQEVWRGDVERGLVAAPIVHGDLVILGSTGRVLTVISAEDGREYWHRRFNGPVAGSPLRIGNVLVAATAARDGRIYAFTLERGRKLWQRRLHAPVTADPIVHAGRVYAATLRHELFALDAGTGAVVWTARTPGPVLGAPVPHGDALLISTTLDTLARLDLQTGRVEAAVALPGTPTATAALAGDRLLVPVHGGGVAVYRAESLELLRVDTLDAPVLAAPAVAADGDVYLLTRDASVWQLGPAGAARIARLGGTARESLTLAANGLLVGLLDGTLIMLRPDGTELWRQAYPGSIRAPVALSAGAAYLGLLNGRFVKLQ